jgi:hypothetical protein
MLESPGDLYADGAALQPAPSVESDGGPVPIAPARVMTPTEATIEETDEDAGEADDAE